MRVSIEKAMGDLGVRDDITSLSYALGNYEPNSQVDLHFTFDEISMLVEKGEQYAGPLKESLIGGFPKEFLDTYQALLFKNYASLNAVKGINSSKTPVFIAHGNRDFVISYHHQSVISHKDEIRREGVTYYVGTGAQAGHNTILHSERAVAYQKQVEAELKRLKKEYDRDLTQEEQAEFCRGVDHGLYSEVNEDLMQAVLQVFDT